ncbi:ATP-dependent zinc metalloprotease FtsH [Prochlorococcus sp. MIT 1341]|uniref:ATP-dependent zinc metalloprotease FtsH n=1 Tax=Prochlorococcus sp. MIT 1341 TaxID=3096221 RepID=UPI002A75F70E|nr:ATP-dependent zinc metalloprotease FtsH [Prochlorococcus sp. MIT 1341]
MDKAIATAFSISRKVKQGLSYSDLLKEIRNGNIVSIELTPSRREVLVKFADGSKNKYAVLPNDQNILRAAQESGTPLSVSNIRQQEALAGVLGNVGIILMIIFALSFLLRRSANIANKAMGFGQSKSTIKPLDELQIHFEDVEGVEEAKEELREIVTFLKQPENYTKLGARIPKGFLLVGPPGTGKTLLAKAIAGEAGVPFFTISASEFVELFVGVGASRVRDLFKKAKEKAPCLIFIDEIDSVGRQRGAGIGGGNDEREQTLNQLLTEMDGFGDNSGIIIIAATNRSDILDSALMRPGRFDRRIEIGLPDRKSREKILSVHARTRPLSENVLMEEWALKTPGFSGADLANLINEAAIYTARNNDKKITNKYLEMAFERITLGLQKSPLLDNSKKRLIAYHEIGHALVATLIKGCDQVDKISILPIAGGMGGVTRFIPDEERMDSGLVTKSYLLNSLIISLGGRAAEILVFGSNEITQGASGDLERVGELARAMVTRFGFSSLGPIALESDNSQVFLGRDLINKRSEYAESTGREIDKQVRIIASMSLEKAIKILEPHRDTMDRLVDALINEEILDRVRFMELANITNV